MTQVLEITADQLEDALYELEVDGQVYEAYSGRAMYGATCFGIVGGGEATAMAGLALAEALGDVKAAAEIAKAARTDSMGLDAIIYFPGFQLAEA